MVGALATGQLLVSHELVKKVSLGWRRPRRGTVFRRSRPGVCSVPYEVTRKGKRQVCALVGVSAPGEALVFSRACEKVSSRNCLGTVSTGSVFLFFLLWKEEQESKFGLALAQDTGLCKT